VLEASTAAGTVWRLVSAGGRGYGSAGPSAQHFGLGGAASVDLKITWPDGEISEIEALASNRRIRVVR
jgi:hypothetical protein